MAKQTLLFVALLLVAAAADEDDELAGSGCISGDCVDGTGVFMSTNGRRYEGAFEGGKEQGPGVSDFPDGRPVHRLFSPGVAARS